MWYILFIITLYISWILWRFLDWYEYSERTTFDRDEFFEMVIGKGLMAGSVVFFFFLLFAV